MFPPPLPAREEMWWANGVFHFPGGVLWISLLAKLHRFGVLTLRNITAWSLAALVRTALKTLPSFERQFRWLSTVTQKWSCHPRAMQGCIWPPYGASDGIAATLAALRTTVNA